MATDDARLARALEDLARAGRPSGTVRRALAEQVAAAPETAALRRLGLDLTGRNAVEGRARSFCAAEALCGTREYDLAGYRVALTVTPAELWRFYLPLARLVGRVRPAGRRLLVGVAGPGAGGKSSLALLLGRVMERTESAGGPVAACPMDGFHFSNAYLDAHTVPGPGGRSCPLREVKGAPATVNVAALLAALKRLQEDAAVRLPRYDRATHEPVPDAIRVGPEHRVVLVEGNYLLLRRGLWVEVGGRLDLRLFVCTPLSAARGALVERFVAGGRGREEAEARYDEVDRANFRTIVPTARRAHVIVVRDAADRLVGLRVAPEAPPLAVR